MAFSCTPRQLTAVTELARNDVQLATTICSTYNVTALGPPGAVLAFALQRLNDVDDKLTGTKTGLDTQFKLQSAFIIFIMQAGFALYAAGVIRSKNTFNILMKNFVDACVAGITFFLFGYALAFGQAADDDRTNGFVGGWNFALTGSSDPAIYAKFMFQWSFCAAASTIMSGAVAERVTFQAYMLYTILFSAWVYPIVVHWVWAPSGWLSAYNSNALLGIGAVDFAGGAVVHLLAGCASLVGAAVCGPRMGRFAPGADAREFKGRSAATFVLGTFLLWFGWYGFNPGSYQRISSQTASEVVGRIAVATTLSGCSGALIAALLGWWYNRSWDLLGTCAGLLSGLVAVTAGCSVLPTWAAIMCGAAAAAVYFYAERAVETMEVDDPVGAFAMHGCCGFLGLMMVGLLADEKYMIQVYEISGGRGNMGLFMGGNGKLLAAQLLMIVCVAAWSLAWSSALFLSLRQFGWLRVTSVEEVVGIDVYSHGEIADVSQHPNATKYTFRGAGPAMNDSASAYPSTPVEVDTPVTLRMDSIGNMRWTPRFLSGNGGPTTAT